MSFENRGKSTAIPAITRFIILPNQREQFARVLKIDGTVSSNVFRRCTINNSSTLPQPSAVSIRQLSDCPLKQSVGDAAKLHARRRMKLWAANVIETQEYVGDFKEPCERNKKPPRSER